MTIQEILAHLGKVDKDLSNHVEAILKHVNDNNIEIDNILPLENSREDNSNFFTVSPSAIQAFNEVILPQIKLQAIRLTATELANIAKDIQSLGTSKNQGFEDALVVYMPVSVTHRRFWKEVNEVFSNWMRNRLS